MGKLAMPVSLYNVNMLRYSERVQQEGTKILAFLPGETSIYILV